jgi:DNA polymerase-3 subunit alpha
MVSGVAKKSTKTGKAMAVVTLEDMEGEVSCVVFPNLYEECAATLAGQVNDMGESEGDVFVSITGKLERSDRGMQIICSKIDALELSDRTNRPKVIKVVLPSSKFTRGCMEKLNSTLLRFEGMDHIEVFVHAGSGDTLRLALPQQVDAHNGLLLTLVKDILGKEGNVVLV